MKDMKWGLGLCFFLLLSIILMLSPSLEKRHQKINTIDETTSEESKKSYKEFYNPLNDVKLVDNKDIYKDDVDSNVEELYVTILPPQNYGAVTFEELNRNINHAHEDHTLDAHDPVVEIIFETNRPIKDNILYNKSNATMEIRGQSSRSSKRKSYKIKLFDNTERWNGFKTINLNKHHGESLHIKNKLSFDYFEMIPDFVSLRTRFVKLYIKDLSSKKLDKEFKNYGLYTFVEQPNKRFLKRHNLDSKGHLYKAEFFEFFRYPDHIKSKDEISFDINKFEEILEVRGNDNHEKLIEMLEAVNDYKRDINEVVDKHFDRDNLLTWLSVNILLNNRDTTSRNFLIYSPLNSDKWFFIPWDYDKTWRTVYRGEWEKGISNYWGMVLFQRFFKDSRNVEELSKKIEELSNIINEKDTLNFLDSYYPVVKENIFELPDWKYLKTSVAEYNKEYYSIVEIPTKNKEYYYEALENPMPFFLGDPKNENGKYRFNWDYSYDLQGDDLTYKFILSTDYEFRNIVAEYKDLRNNSCKVGKLKSGEYFWKVIAYDSKGNWQEAFDYYKIDGYTICGIRRFIVQ